MGVLGSAWGWISVIFNLLKNSPAIIGLIEQIIELIGSLTGDAGADEVQTVEQTKRKLADLSDLGVSRIGKSSDLVGKGKL